MSLSTSAQFLSPRLNFVEQARILYGDDRLVGECGDQRNLFFGERPNDAPRQKNDANRNALAQKWNAQHCPIVSDPYEFA